MRASIPSSTLDKFTTFGDLLRYLRRRAVLNQLELSFVVGYSDAQISRLEQNVRRPDLSMIQDAASGSGKPALVRAGLVPTLRWNKRSAFFAFALYDLAIRRTNFTRFLLDMKSRPVPELPRRAIAVAQRLAGGLRLAEYQR